MTILQPSEPPTGRIECVEEKIGLVIHDRITLGGENELLNKRLTMNLNAVQLVVVISDQPGNTHKQHNKIRYERCKRYERIICDNEIRVSKEKRVKHKKTAQNHTLIVTCNH